MGGKFGVSAMTSVAEDRDTVAVCPVPECNEGQCEERTETATQVKVFWTTCKLCDGLGVVPVWKASEWRTKHASRSKISGVMRRGGF